VDLDVFIITVFCMMDDALKRVCTNQSLRQRGPEPKLADSEVLTMEVVGEFLGYHQDKALFRYFRDHFRHFFPALRQVHRTTFLRQAANLWKVKESIWQYLLTVVDYNPQLAIVDSLPLPVCQFARAYRCRNFKGQADYGKDILVRQTFYGFRLHVRLCWPGVITRVELAPANVSELRLVPELVTHTHGSLVGDRNYWSPLLSAQLHQSGIELNAPFRRASTDPWPERSRYLSRFRYLIDTVFGQLAERYRIKRVWARDLWHLTSRLLRKILSHTIAVLLSQNNGNPVLHLANLVD
jgi:hypothetical protein